MKIVMTGANGFLGTELQKYIDCIPLDIDDVDITDEKKTKEIFEKLQPDVTVHLAAIVSVVDAERDRNRTVKVNIEGTRIVASCSSHIIYMSSDYVFDGERGMYKEEDIPNPRTFIGITKWMGEFNSFYAPRVTIIRTSFKPEPFKHNQAPSDMFTSADYISVIAPMIAKAVKNAYILPKILHIGTERKSVYDLAIRTKPDIKKISLKDIPYSLPKDCSLDTFRWDKLFQDI